MNTYLPLAALSERLIFCISMAAVLTTEAIFHRNLYHEHLRIPESL